MSKRVKKSKEYGKTLATSLKRMRCHISDYESIFRNRTERFFVKAKKYTEGVVKIDMRNIERISEDTGVDYFQMQHFITESNWDARKLIDKVAVFACLSNGDFASMSDARLFLPKDWCNDVKRCQKAGIPEKKMAFRSKLELASAIVRHQKEQGIAFDFVTADDYYGNDASLAREIENLGSVYMLDIHSDQEIYLEKPELILPRKKSVRGRKPKRFMASIPGIKVNAYLTMLKAVHWQILDVQNTTKDVLRGEYHFAKGWIWDKSTAEPERRLLVIRNTTSGKGTVEIKYSFTNANLEQYEPEGIACMQSGRYFIEHNIKESKQIPGLDQFQTRKWVAWQHQIALNFLVSSFILKEKLELFEEMPLLSAMDVKEMVICELYEQMTQDQMLNRINKRHTIRQKDINRYYWKKSNLSIKLDCKIYPAVYYA